MAAAMPKSARKKATSKKRSASVDAPVVSEPVEATKKRCVEDVLTPGSIVTARVAAEDAGQLRKSPFVEVKVHSWCHARLALTEVSDVDSWQSAPFQAFKPGQFVRCVVLERVKNSRDGRVVDVTMRPSVLPKERLGDKQLNPEVIRAELEAASRYPAEGELVKGFVESAVDKVGVFVRISRGVLALVPLKHLADRFVDNVKKEFPVGKLVAGRVLTVEESNRKVVLSLRASSVLGPNELRTLDNLEPGVVAQGSVASVTKYGVFVRLDKSANLSGLCHVSELSDERVTNHESLYSRGDRVKVVVIKVDKKARRVALSMKPSRLAEAGPDSDAADDDDDEASDDGQGDGLRLFKSEPRVSVGDDSDSSDDDSDDSDEQDGENDAMDDSDDDDSGSDDSDNEDDDKEEEEEEKEAKHVPAMSLEEALKQTALAARSGENWTVAANRSSSGAENHGSASDSDSDSDSNDEDSDSSGDDSDGGEAKSGSKKEKQKARRDEAKREAKRRALEEAETAAREQAKLEDQEGPQSVEDFERMLMGSPNSSMMWIKYMAFQVAQAELDQARAVAERAMQTINYRMETEKQNVLLALLRIECKHGDDASVDTVVKQILERMDKDAAYLEMAKVFEENGDADRADDALRKAVKASQGQSEVPWLRRMELKFKASDAAGAQELLKGAQRNVVKQVRPRLYTGYARLEFSMQELGGQPERARTILEGLVDENPKRNDLWLQYIDLEIKFGNDPAKVRLLFERATTMGFSIKKTKTFFKRWLLYETDHGTEDDAENVKEKARAYVEALTSSAA